MQYYFCDSSDCEVVYFALLSWPKQELPLVRTLFHLFRLILKSLPGISTCLTMMIVVAKFPGAAHAPYQSEKHWD